MRSDPLFDDYKQARNRIRGVDPQSFIRHAIDALHFAYARGIEALSKYQPWNLLLAIKWALQEADALSHRRRPATADDLRKVLNILHDIEGRLRLPSDYEHVSLFIRHLAFQQFSLQRGPNAEAVARQHLLFSSLPPEHPFARQFVRATSIPLGEYVVWLFVLLTPLIAPAIPKVLRLDYFRASAGVFGPTAADSFLATVSKTIRELQKLLTSPQFRNMSVADQKILPSPLLDVPLISSGSGEFAVVSPPLLMRSVESMVYRTLRRDDPAGFGVKFGPIFERYVDRCRADAETEYRDEAWLKSRLTGDGKCVDFLVREEAGAILIDAKGIEMSARGRVSQRADLVFSAIKESAVKAVRQGMATYLRIRSCADEWMIGATRGETFLMIVTYDSLFLGSSVDFEAIFGGYLLPKLQRDYGSPLPISLDRVFFVTVDELEFLLGLVRAKATTLVGLLSHARSADAQPATRRFHFRQHLEPFESQYKRLPILEAALHDIAQRCTKRLAG
jgi:hypothetical protein